MIKEEIKDQINLIREHLAEIESSLHGVEMGYGREYMQSQARGVINQAGFIIEELED